MNQGSMFYFAEDADKSEKGLILDGEGNPKKGKKQLDRRSTHEELQQVGYKDLWQWIRKYGWVNEEWNLSLRNMLEHVRLYFKNNLFRAMQDSSQRPIK